MKTYQLSRKAVSRRQRAVRSVSAERDWEGRRDSRSPPAHRSKTSNSARRDTSEDQGTGCSRGAGEGNRGRSPVRKPVGENSASPRRSKPPRSIICYDCKEPGHVRRNCPRRSNQESQRPYEGESDEETKPIRRSFSKVTFSDTPNIKATYVIPSVRSGSQCLNFGAWRIPL